LLWLLKVNEERVLASREFLTPALLPVRFGSASGPTSVYLPTETVFPMIDAAAIRT